MPGIDDKKLQETLELVRSNREESAKFVADPEAYLQSKGVDTEGLKFGHVMTEELSEAELELAAGGMLAKQVCTSVGAGVPVQVCTSVGDDVPSVE